MGDYGNLRRDLKRGSFGAGDGRCVVGGIILLSLTPCVGFYLCRAVVMLVTTLTSVTTMSVGYRILALPAF